MNGIFFYSNMPMPIVKTLLVEVFSTLVQASYKKNSLKAAAEKLVDLLPEV